MAGRNEGSAEGQDEHVYSVTKVGGRYKSRFDISSNLDENEVVTELEEKCAESVMDALADFNRVKLNAILDIADQEANNIDLHRKVLSDINQNITGYSFWSVSMIISNNGKNPISFSPNATLYADMSGTNINNGGNLAVSLKALDKNGDSVSIVVPGNESRSVSFISSDLVRDYPDWKKVIEAFRQSSRKSVVVLYPQTGWQQHKVIYSPIKNFGPPAQASSTEPESVAAHFTSQW